MVSVVPNSKLDKGYEFIASLQYFYQTKTFSKTNKGFTGNLFREFSSSIKRISAIFIYSPSRESIPPYSKRIALVGWMREINPEGTISTKAESTNITTFTAMINTQSKLIGTVSR